MIVYYIIINTIIIILLLFSLQLHGGRKRDLLLSVVLCSRSMITINKMIRVKSKPFGAELWVLSGITSLPKIRMCVCIWWSGFQNTTRKCILGLVPVFSPDYRFTGILQKKNKLGKPTILLEHHVEAIGAVHARGEQKTIRDRQTENRNLNSGWTSEKMSEPLVCTKPVGIEVSGWFKSLE